MSDEDEQLHAMTDYELRCKADRLLREIYDLPQAPGDKALRKVKRTIAANLARAGLELDCRSRCRLPDGSVLWINTREYEPYIYRMYIGAPLPGGYRSMNRLSELSFIETDLERIDGTDLAGFLARLQADQGEPFPWPLFSYDESQRHARNCV